MGRRKYVLIVDDCQQDRMAVADVLRSDYDILEACNGKQALEILSRKRAQISLIMLDLMMPVMDGYEFLEMYRKRKEYSYLPVVVCTTEDDPEREQKSLELGAWDFVLKNSSPGLMRLRAGNAIEKSKVRFLEYDFLTGIYGQQKFYQATRELLDQRAGANFAFIHFDIDRFRIINTLYGSKEGDRLIHFVAGAIRRSITYWKESGQRSGNIPYIIIWRPARAFIWWTIRIWKWRRCTTTLRLRRHSARVSTWFTMFYIRRRSDRKCSANSISLTRWMPRWQSSSLSSISSRSTS